MYSHLVHPNRHPRGTGMPMLHRTYSLLIQFEYTERWTCPDILCHGHIPFSPSNSPFTRGCLNSYVHWAHPSAVWDVPWTGVGHPSPWHLTSQTASRSFSHSSRQRVDPCPLEWAATFPFQNCPFTYDAWWIPEDWTPVRPRE